MDGEEAGGPGNDVEPNQGLSPEVVQALALLRQQKTQASALAKSLQAVLLEVKATETFVSDQVCRFSVDSPHLQAALIATGFVQTKGLAKGERLTNQVACTIRPEALRLTTHSATLHCTTEIPLALSPGVPFVQDVSFRLKHAKMRDAFAHPKQNVVSSPVLKLGFHPVEQYLYVYLETGVLPFATVPAAPDDQAWNAESFSPPQPVRPDILVQGLESVFVSLAGGAGDPRYHTIDVSGGRMRAASDDTFSVFEHPALAGLTIKFHAEDASQLVSVLQRFQPGQTTVSSSPDWYRFDDGVLTLWTKRPTHDIIPGIDRTIREAESDALVHAAVDREKLWQILTAFRYFLRVQHGERLGGVAFPNPPVASAELDTPVKMLLSAKSVFEPDVRPELTIQVDPEASLLDLAFVAAASEMQLIDFIHLERLARRSSSETLSLRLGEGGLLVTEKSADHQALNLLQTHRP
jgi:hypothetical protein